MVQIGSQHLFEIQNLGLVIYQGQHIDAKGILQLGMLIKLIKDDISIGVLSGLNADSHTMTIRFVTKVSDAIHSLFSYQRCDLFDQSGFIYHIGNFGDDDPLFTILHWLNAGHSPHLNLSPAGKISPLNLFPSKNHGTGGKIRTFDDIHQFFDGSIPVFLDLILNDLKNAIDGLCQVMRRNIGGHTYGNALSPIYHKIGKSGGKNTGFFFRLIKVRNKIHSIFIDIGCHLHGYFGKSCLCVTHGGGTVTVYGPKVSMPVYQRITGGPFLGQINQGTVYRGITVWVIFTHGITYDTGTLSVRLIRAVIELNHRMKNSSLNRFQSIPDIRKSSGYNDTHGVINIGTLHRLFQINFIYIIKNSAVVHIFLHPND